MNYVLCQVMEPHGDCLRACVASVLSMEADDVPHFFHDACDGPTGAERVRVFAAQHGLAPCYVTFPGDVPLPDLLEMWGNANGAVPTILYGRTQDEDHCVVMLNGRVEHNPSWSNSPIVGPTSNGFWHALVFVQV